MALSGWCGGSCGNEKKCADCRLDQSIPCSPNCENLTQDGIINLKKCFADGCEEPKYIFGMPEATAEEIIARYGAIAPYF